MKGTASVEQIGIHATALTLAEMGLGSTLHAFHIPFAGTFLSLNQIFLLTRHLYLTQDAQRTLSPFFISTQAALFKSLAPIGKKLTPMLAICMQGMLYNLGILCFGNTFFGRWTGGLISSVWSFCQPLLLYWFLFGESLFQAIETFTWVKGLFWGLFICKTVAASLVVLLSPLLPVFRFEQYFHILSRAVPSESRPQKSSFKQALSDLCKPLFLFSILITGLFFYFSQGVTNALLWGVLRPLGIGFICFFIMRLFPLKWRELQNSLCRPPAGFRARFYRWIHFLRP